jgi:hypothetical protein
VAAAAPIEAFTNSGTSSYSISDTAANLSAATAALTIGATTIAVSDAVTVAQAISLLAANPTATYALSDTAAALAAAATDVGQQATLVNASDAVTLAQIDAIHAPTSAGAAARAGGQRVNLKAASAGDPASLMRSFTVTARRTWQADVIHAYNAFPRRRIMSCRTRC